MKKIMLFLLVSVFSYSTILACSASCTFGSCSTGSAGGTCGCSYYGTANCAAIGVLPIANDLQLKAQKDFVAFLQTNLTSTNAKVFISDVSAVFNAMANKSLESYTANIKLEEKEYLNLNKEDQAKITNWISTRK